MNISTKKISKEMFDLSVVYRLTFYHLSSVLLIHYVQATPLDMW